MIEINRKLKKKIVESNANLLQWNRYNEEKKEFPFLFFINNVKRLDKCCKSSFIKNIEVFQCRCHALEIMKSKRV